MGNSFYHKERITRPLVAAAIIIISFALHPFAQTNVALSKQVTVSTVQTGNIASNAVDGNTSTRWCASSGSVPQWLTVDLGGNYDISRTEVMWEKTAVYKYKIETSPDNSTWTQRVDRTTNTASQQTFIDYFTITARYVRITATSLPSGTWASIFEFRVFGNNATMAPTITAQPASLTVTEGQSATFNISATGNPTPGYQWRRNGNNISGANGTSYTINSTAMADSGVVFSCVVSNAAGSVTSSNAVLTVQRNLRRQDSLALVAIYNSTGGPNWANKTNWLTSQPIDTWLGIKVVAGRVTELNLRANNLIGSLVQRLADLTALQVLDLSSNRLSGKIYSEFGNLKNLTYLALSQNSLSDTIPNSLGTLSNLQSLILNENNFTGQIPASLGNLRNLVTLYVYNNQLSGQIPSALGNLTNLWNLLCDNNQLSGPIPSELGNLTHLYRFSFANNQLTGVIPPEIGNLSSLTDLYLNSNRLTGPVPWQLGRLSQLNHLFLNNNSFTSLPDSIYHLSNITACDLGNNQFCNTASFFVADWANAHDSDWALSQACATPERTQDSLALISLYNSTGGPNWTIKTNWLTSQPIHTWSKVIVSNNRVTAIDIRSENNLNGSLPADIGNLTSLTLLDLSSQASLRGQIPNEIGNLTNLSQLIFSYDNISGRIPSDIGRLTNLMILDLEHNLLTDTIPSSIGNLTTHLAILSLGKNRLTGTIPSSIGNLRSCTNLDLGNNNLVGSIPSTIGNMVWAREILLNNNQLSGSLPAQIGNLSDLASLFVNNNLLTNIPAEITNLTNLSSVDLRYNQFCNLSPTLVAWANAKNPGWANTQTCAKPEVQITANPTTGVSPLAVVFTASNIGSSSIETWSWNFGDGGTASSQNTSHTYTNTGTFIARLIVTGIGGSDTASVNIQVTNPPVIITQPASQTVNQGATVNFSVEVSGATPLSFQWYKNGSIISGATASTYTKSNVQQADTGSYTVRVSNSFGSVTSNTARLNVIIPPTIITQPVSQTVYPGATVTFSVAASGTPPLTYHWSKNWIGIPGATDTSYTIPSVQFADSGAYFVVVSNSAGSTKSMTVQLFVIDPTLRRQDSLALVALYNSTGGPNWTNKTNWLTAQPIDTWSGVYVVGGRVNELRLDGNGLTGSLPDEISNLSALRYLTIVNNRGLQGPIPAGIGNMTALESLLLFSNKLSGAIPTGLQNLTKLILLMLNDNDLSDTIPSCLGSLPSLETIFLNSNRLVGVIPATFGRLTKLKDLGFGGNQLTGQIPSEIGDIKTLTGLELQYNQLSGRVPAHIGNLTNLTLLNIEHNSFTDLPDSIANLTNITGCNLGQNQFCNLSSRAVGWANIYDSDWASTQICAKPDIQITATPISGPPPLTVAFTATNVGSTMIENWNWSFDDGGTATTQNPTHVYARGGTFDARLIAKGIGNSGFDTAVIPIRVDTLPLITTQPASQSVQQGGEATFRVVATGTAPLSYQWYKNGTLISEATSSNYSITNVQPADSGNYSVVVHNVAGSITSAMAHLTVTLPPLPPVITRDPESQTVSAGGSVLFSVMLTGTQPFSYAWQKNGIAVGGNTPVLTISPVSFADSGLYRVIVSNNQGSVTSAAAKLSVVPVINNATNRQMSIRGMLYDTTGTPVGNSITDTIEATVRLYNSLTGGTVQYAEFFRKADQHQIAVKKGAFTINLGQGTTTDTLQSVLVRDPNLWVEITVDGLEPDVLLPRLPLTSSPYSIVKP